MSRSEQYLESARRFDAQADKQEAFARDLRERGQRDLAREYEHQAGDNRRLARDARDLARD